MVFSWYTYKVWKLDCHEISANMLSHGMKNIKSLDITMRRMERGRYHGKKIKVNMEGYHDTMSKVFCHGNDKEVAVKKYHEEVIKLFCHGKESVRNKIVYHEK